MEGGGGLFGKIKLDEQEAGNALKVKVYIYIYIIAQFTTGGRNCGEEFKKKRGGGFATV